MPPGRWVEVKRLNPDSMVWNFTDTLFMTFQIRDTFTYRVRNGFIYKGKYTYDEDDHLEFGWVSYIVAQKRPNSLILANTKGIYYYVKDTSDTAAVIVLDSAEKIEPVTDLEQMLGKWTVYKRELDKDAIGVSYSDEIKYMYITGQGTDDKKGYVYCGPDPVNSPSCYIQRFEGDQMLECFCKKPRSLKVVKCQKGELVIVENGVSYYFKQFK